MKIFFDENFSPKLSSGLQKLQDGIYDEDIEVLSIKEKFFRGIPDEEWIPKIAQMHGTVITQDLNIHRTKLQYSLCKKNKIGIIFFKPPRESKINYWEWVVWVIKRWSNVKDCINSSSRPFAYRFTPRKAKPEKL
ncbi:MAG: hypothetical protein V3U21_05975 [Thermodesulfobacteriota bacterium]